MILKGIKQEGRIRIYLMSFVMVVLGGSAFELPRLWMQAIAVFLLCMVYLYATSYVAKKFAYKKRAQHKCKEVRK